MWVEPCHKGDKRYVAFTKATNEGEARSNHMRYAFIALRKTNDYQVLLKKYRFKFLRTKATGTRKKP